MSQRTIAQRVDATDYSDDEQRATVGMSDVSDTSQCFIGGAVEYRGMPAAGATVVARLGERAFPGMADAQGAFLIGPVPPGRYAIEAYGYGGLAGATAPTDVECGITNTRLVIIDRGTIGGMIRDDEDRPLVDAVVHLTYQGEGFCESTTARSDIDGQFQVQCLWPGEWMVLATHTSGNVAGIAGPLTLREAEWIQDIDVRLRPAATVRLEFNAAAVDAAPRSVWIRSAGQCLRAHLVGTSAPSVLCVPAGRAQVEVTSRFGSAANRGDFLLAPGDRVVFRID